MNRVIKTYRTAWRSAKATPGAKGLFTQAVLVMFAVIPAVVVAGVVVLVGTVVPAPFSAAAFGIAFVAFWPIAWGALYACLLVVFATARMFVVALRPRTTSRAAEPR